MGSVYIVLSGYVIQITRSRGRDKYSQNTLWLERYRVCLTTCVCGTLASLHCFAICVTISSYIHIHFPYCCAHAPIMPKYARECVCTTLFCTYATVIIKKQFKITGCILFILNWFCVYVLVVYRLACSIKSLVSHCPIAGLTDNCRILFTKWFPSWKNVSIGFLVVLNDVNAHELCCLVSCSL